MKNDIDLYEDNAGGLYLHPLGSAYVYQDHPLLNPGSRFDKAALALSENEELARMNWSEEWVLDYRERQPWLFRSERIATWYHDRPRYIHRVPGTSGQQYLGLAREEAEQYPVIL